MKEIREVYEEKVAGYSGLVEKTGRRLFLLSMLRLVVFLAGLALLIILWKKSQPLAVGSFIVALIGFFYLLKKYSEFSFRNSFFSNLLTINQDEIKGLNNDYSPFDGGEEYIDLHHDYSHDIDLFGKNSLYQYINRTCTDRGKEILATWLKDPLPLSKEMEERQEAVKELAGMIDWRQKFKAYGIAGETGKPIIKDMEQWITEEPHYYNNRWYNIIRIMVPAITLVILGLTVAAILHYSFLIMMILVNLLIISLNIKTLNNAHARVSKKHNQLRTLTKLISHFEDTKFTSVFIRKMQKLMSGNPDSASQVIGKLSKIIQAFDSRLNMILVIPLNGLLLWDIQCVHRLEKWKIIYGKSITRWFDILGHMDAISSLANYAGNNMENSYPVISTGDEFLSAKHMGHPLIPANVRVNNDFTISKRGEIIIVTGANMAGKSTFLRTVAVNLILAMSGAPVCARVFSFSPCHLYSSMRTTDSLSDQESYFYAELKRLRTLKERLEKGENIFFLLDEILKGTNSKDKSEGSKLFIERIITYKATGIVATHDILLGKLAETYENVINMCFEIEIVKDEVRFDYLLRDGMTTKMNAALLMNQMGIV